MKEELKELVFKMWNEGYTSREISECLRSEFNHHIEPGSIKQLANYARKQGRDIAQREKGWNMKVPRLAKLPSLSRMRQKVTGS